ncbi:hypothetical protein [Sunxiuqinia indica]|nr:hypothetical protein [Sunxiuqinia indica]
MIPQRIVLLSFGIGLQQQEIALLRYGIALLGYGTGAIPKYPKA